MRAEGQRGYATGMATLGALSDDLNLELRWPIRVARDPNCNSINFLGGDRDRSSAGRAAKLDPRWGPISPTLTTCRVPQDGQQILLPWLVIETQAGARALVPGAWGLARCRGLSQPDCDRASVETLKRSPLVILAASAHSWCQNSSGSRDVQRGTPGAII
jgi:hypothetical protein